MIANDTKKHETMPLDLFQSARFKFPQLSAGRAPLLLNPAAVSVSEEVTDKRTAREPSSEPQLSLNGVRRLGSLETIIAADAAFIPPPRCVRCQATTGLRRTETCCPRCRLTARLDELIGAKKLSPGVWERIRCIFCLPKAADKMPLDQARAVFQVLNLFVSRVTITEQAQLSAGELVERLLALPDLPPVFTKILRQRIATTRRNNTAKTCKDNDGGKRDGSNETQIGKNNLNAPNAKRKPVSAAQFTEVAVRQGCYCYWCGIRVVREAQIPPINRMHKNGNTILYYVGDDLREEAVGTIDHLLRVSDGGDNSLMNLVISCYQCNQERERITLAYGRPFARRRMPCRSCGGRFFHPDWGCCSICGAMPERARKSSRWFGYLTEKIKRWRRVV